MLPYMHALESLASRHEFYESDNKLTLSIFDKGADPSQVTVIFDPRKVCAFFHALYNYHFFVVYLHKWRQIPYT